MNLKDLKITWVLFPKHYTTKKNLDTFLREFFLNSNDPIDGIPKLSQSKNTWVTFKQKNKDEEIQTTLLSFLSDDAKTGWSGFEKLEEWVEKGGVRDYPNVAIQKLKQILKYYNCCRNKRKRDSVLYFHN